MKRFRMRIVFLLSYLCFILINGTSCKKNSKTLRPHNVYAYMTNSNNNSVTACLVNGANLDDCNLLFVPGLLNPSGIAIANGYAFIVNSINSAGSITSCLVGEGVLTSCTTTDANSNVTSFLNSPYAISVHNGYAFITNDTNPGSLISCQVNGGNLTECGIAPTPVTPPASPITL